MGLAHYIVAQRGAGWFILMEKNRYGPFPDGRDGALTAAVQAANQAGKDGHHAHVSLRALDGTKQTVWSFGIDRYPPRWVDQLLLVPPPRSSRPRPAGLMPKPHASGDVP